jgi:hypothetical protein
MIARPQSRPLLPVAIEDAAHRVASAVLIGLSIANVVWAITDWGLYDLITYLDAAQMWVDTGNPYTPTPRADQWMLYRYAPWFAALFVPLLSLPRTVVEIGFSIAMTIASVLAIVPMIRQHGREGIPVAMFLGTMLFGIGTGGNIQPAMVAMLVWTLATRWGPVGVAVAASLKLTPLLFVLVYAGQREWGKVIWTLALTAILLGPIVIFPLPAQATSAGPSGSLIHVHVALWAGVGLAAIAFAAWESRRLTPTRWLATCVAVIMASPRLLGYDLTVLLAASPAHRQIRTPADPARGQSGLARPRRTGCRSRRSGSSPTPGG